MLPDQYKWLANESNPPLLDAALKYYGLKESPGGADNPVIMEWAKEFGITWYVHDSIAWCSLFMGKAAKDAGYTPPGPSKLLAAVSWDGWGWEVYKPQKGDIMVFNRPGGHHVAINIGEDNDAYHGLGGNTGDAVAIARISKDRLIYAGRPFDIVDPVKINQYHIRTVLLSSSGILSHNEA